MVCAPPVVEQRRPSLWKVLNPFGGKNEEKDAFVSTEEVDNDSPVSIAPAAAAELPATNEDERTLKSKRSFSAFKFGSRRPSEAASVKPRQQSPPGDTKEVHDRRPSTASVAQRSPGRRPSWFQSSNPDDEDIPRVPALPAQYDTRKTSSARKMSAFTSTTESTSGSPPAEKPRRPSYVPKNAASSFLRTTTPKAGENVENAKPIVPTPHEEFQQVRAVSPQPRAVSPQPPAVKLPTVLNDPFARHRMMSNAGTIIESPDEAAHPPPAYSLKVDKPTHLRIDSAIPAGEIEGTGPSPSGSVSPTEIPAEREKALASLEGEKN